MAKTVRVYMRVQPEVFAALKTMAKRGGFRSVPNFAMTWITRMVREACIASGEVERGATPHDEIAEMFNEFTDAQAPRYGMRTKRTRRYEPKS